jgi:hypothetical protein
MFKTKVIVAPNSPRARAKERIRTGDGFRGNQRERYRQDQPGSARAQCARRFFEPAVKRLDRQLDRPDEERKSHNPTGARHARPPDAGANQ